LSFEHCQIVQRNPQPLFDLYKRNALAFPFPSQINPEFFHRWKCERRLSTILSHQVNLLALHPKLPAGVHRRQKKVEYLASDSASRVLGDALSYAFNVNFSAQWDHTRIDGHRTAGKG